MPAYLTRNNISTTTCSLLYHFNDCASLDHNTKRSAYLISVHKTQSFRTLDQPLNKLDGTAIFYRPQYRCVAVLKREKKIKIFINVNYRLICINHKSIDERVDPFSNQPHPPCLFPSVPQDPAWRSGGIWRCRCWYRDGETCGIMAL